MGTVRIARAEFPQMRDRIAALLTEYQQDFGRDPCFHRFSAELAALPGEYAPEAGGAIFVAMDGDGALAGCIALRRMGDGICEMKRLYVRAVARGSGAGRLLVQAIVEEGRRLGYRVMRLDTIRESMKPAIALYRSIGFREIEPYYGEPIAGVLYLELNLNPAAEQGGATAPRLAGAQIEPAR